MPEVTNLYNDPFIESISFLYHYLLMRLRNDKEGDFYLGIEEYKLLIEAVNLKKNDLTLDKLKTIFCRLFAKSPYQELRLVQHVDIVLQYHQELLYRLKQAGIGDEAPVDPANKTANEGLKTDENKTPSIYDKKSGSDTVFTRKEQIKKQIARITLPTGLEAGRYEISQKYNPASKREMSIFSRRLHKGPTSYAASDMLDIDKTVQSIAKLGFFIHPVYANQKQKLKTYVLIDNSDSMIPFEKLIRDFTASLKSYVHLNELYFKNYPVRQLFSEKKSVSSVNLKEWIAELNKNSFIIIVSDAGSARGGFNEKRVAYTQTWMRLMKERTNRIIWLNPMPAGRWMDTTAWELTSAVNMYSFSRLNLEKAMQKVGL